MLGQVQGGLAPGEGTMEEPGGQSRGRCRLRQVQGGSAIGERALENQAVGVRAWADAGLDRYRVP